MAKGDLEGVERLARILARLTPAVRKAAGQEAFMQAEEMAAQMRSIAPVDPDPNDGERVREHIYVEEGRLGDVSYVVISDAKDAKGRPKAPRVELGHKADDGSHVPPSPSFYPVVRASQKRVKRRIASATAILAAALVGAPDEDEPAGEPKGESDPSPDESSGSRTSTR